MTVHGALDCLIPQRSPAAKSHDKKEEKSPCPRKCRCSRWPHDATCPGRQNAIFRSPRHFRFTIVRSVWIFFWKMTQPCTLAHVLRRTPRHWNIGNVAIEAFAKNNTSKKVEPRHAHAFLKSSFSFENLLLQCSYFFCFCYCPQLPLVIPTCTSTITNLCKPGHRIKTDIVPNL